jgi:glutamate N-acetyltransferase / amino-acid N-acetyltransferase
MTTDTFPKGAVRRPRSAASPVTVAGIAKGSGMIAPDMATMLAFVFTDAGCRPRRLQVLLRRRRRQHLQLHHRRRRHLDQRHAAAFATGQGPASARERSARSAPRRLPRGAGDVLRDLAQQVVRDGEGAGKFVTITVTGAPRDGGARRIGLAIANSPLVKTAIAGEDANWGRIVMAVGKSGERADRDRLSIMAERGDRRRSSTSRSPADRPGAPRRSHPDLSTTGASPPVQPRPGT